MMRIINGTLVIIMYFISTYSYSSNEQSKDWATIIKCWQNMQYGLDDAYLTLHYEEEMHLLHHGKRPWSSRKYQGMGIINLNTKSFLKTGTLSLNEKQYHSTIQYIDKTLIKLDYGKKEKRSGSKQEYDEISLELIRYTPLLLLEYFISHREEVRIQTKGNSSLYTIDIGNKKVSMKIDNSMFVVDHISINEPHELYSTIESKYIYEEYTQIKNGGSTPTKNTIHTYNGHVRDTVYVKSTAIGMEQKPQFTEDLDKLPAPVDDTYEGIDVEKFSKNMYLLKFSQADSMSILVEFDDYFLVGDVPLSEENGRLAIDAVTKLNPKKPIKYYIFTHHHPHYIGGIRAFAKIGSEIIIHDSNRDYVEEILNPKVNGASYKHIAPVIHEIDEKGMIIDDGKYRMEVIYMGELSAHTYDYLLYYFPQDQVLYQGDLARIKKHEPTKREPAAQRALLSLIREKNLEVDTVLQSWPLEQYSFKTTIPIADLESVSRKNQDLNKE